MKIYQFSLGLFCGIVLCSTSFAAGRTDCDLLYSHRGTDLFKAADCYSQERLTASAPAAQMSLYEMGFIALSAMVSDSPATANERLAIDQGLSLAQKLTSDFPNSADAPYWTAAFISFDAIARDRGLLIPTHTFGAIRTIQKNLSIAIQINPAIHFYGPDRVLGIMNIKMPGVIGGDKALAEKLLREAYQNSPALSANHLMYSKILVINGKKDEARTALNHFLSMNDEELNCYPGQPLLAFTEEVARDRVSAKELLASLDD